MADIKLPWLSGKDASSRREGYLYWTGTDLYGVRWRNFKARPHIINLIADPQEREPLNLPYLHSRTATHFNRLLADYQASVKRETPIPAGAPLDFVPAQPPD
jgi:hypothetical protein